MRRQVTKGANRFGQPPKQPAFQPWWHAPRKKGATMPRPEWRDLRRSDIGNSCYSCGGVIKLDRPRPPTGSVVRIWAVPRCIVAIVACNALHIVACNALQVGCGAMMQRCPSRHRTRQETYLPGQRPRPTRPRHRIRQGDPDGNRRDHRQGRRLLGGLG